jgi:hypothetical protein
MILRLTGGAQDELPAFVPAPAPGVYFVMQANKNREPIMSLSDRAT